MDGLELLRRRRAITDAADDDGGWGEEPDALKKLTLGEARCSNPQAGLHGASATLSPGQVHRGSGGGGGGGGGGNQQDRDSAREGGARQQVQAPELAVKLKPPKRQAASVPAESREETQVQDPLMAALIARRRAVDDACDVHDIDEVGFGGRKVVKRDAEALHRVMNARQKHIEQCAGSGVKYTDSDADMALAMGAKILRDVEKESRRRETGEADIRKMSMYSSSSPRQPQTPVGKAGTSDGCASGFRRGSIQARIRALQAQDGGGSQPRSPGVPDLQL